MKKYFTLLLLAATALSAAAEWTSDGYYRVQNFKTGRYLYVTDDKGKVNLQTTSVDLRAIQLWTGFDKAACDPATVLYINKVYTDPNNNEYDVSSQGTAISKILDVYLKLRLVGNSAPGAYLAYGTYDKFTKYLSDGEQSTWPEGVLSDAGSGQYRYWYIHPMGTADTNYFGIKATITAHGQSYAPFYTAFPYSFASSGMQAFYVTKVSSQTYRERYGVVVYKEVTGTIPAATPVWVRCTSAQPIQNKLNIGGSAQPVSDNLLTGVYFNNPSYSHNNQVRYNPATMRVLGVDDEGDLSFITATGLDYIPANSVYLTVPQGSHATYKLMTKAQYDEWNRQTGVETIGTDNSTFDIYNTMGVCVRRDATSLDDLQPGIYIVNGKKYIVR